ncbi:MAG: hypothetical protein ACTJIA_10560 [Halomonas sp.]
MVWTVTNASSLRYEKRWGGLRRYFNTLDDFKSAETMPNGFSTIQAGEALIDISLNLIEGKPLCVFFNGAQERGEKFRLPAFSGKGISPKGEVSRLSINDPALYFSPDISMGWYAGSRFYSTQKVIIPTIIDKIASVANSPRIIFVGGSSGGFASLYFSKKYENSIALVCNPQTNILRYHSGHVKRYLNYCFGLKDIDAVRKNSALMPGVTKNLCYYYKGCAENKIVYLQNLSDEHHVNRHYVPFMKSLGVDPSLELGAFQYGNVLSILGNWGEGHKAAPREVWSILLHDLVRHGALPDSFFETDNVTSLVNSTKDSA